MPINGYKPSADPVTAPPAVDPISGLAAKTGAMRHNAGKFRPSLVPPALVEGCARGMTYGAIKYEDNNWRKGFRWTDVLDSFERHLLAFKQGEDIDEESGLHQLDLMACNLGMLMEFVKTNNGVDNRFKFKKEAA